MHHCPTITLLEWALMAFASIRRNLVRNSRQSQLKSVDNSTTDTQFIGKQGKDFDFSHLSQRIDVAECSAKDNELDAVIEWIEQQI